ncbi:MAG: hypothetical protein QF441_09825 [Bacteriovoracaceae bacterium]|jgi:hypothetical protein|nr:hypothetical protein [Bacteriovoracaceae bacterium]
MNKQMSLFFLVLFFWGQVVASAETKRFPYSYPESESSLSKNSIEQSRLKNYTTIRNLEEIKYHIITGNFDIAKVMLKEAKLTENFSKPIQYRYLALIHFVEGQYQKTLSILNSPTMKNFEHLEKVCLLKVLSHIILGQTKEMTQSWSKCSERIRPFSQTNLVWIQMIIDLKQKGTKKYIQNFFKERPIDSVDKKFLRVYLKLALYLNQQDKIIPRFKFFGASALEDEVFRELIGLNYYRNGNLHKAYQLLKDLDTANAEIFKGNLFLFQKKEELAYAQFKLALQKKSNSLNALERLIPLSWKLSQWQDGVSFLQRIPEEEINELKNHTLMSVFLAMNKKYEDSDQYIKKIKNMKNNAIPLEIAQISVLNLMNLEKNKELVSAAQRNCQLKDVLHCWLLIRLNTWENMLEHTKKKGSLHGKTKNLVDYYAQDNPVKKIEEEKLIQQKYIEELDDKLIKL